MSYTIGLTGGIGCGKSTVATMFEELGIQTVDADQIVRDLLDNDEGLNQEIKAHFGEEYCNAEGVLDRRKLRSHIFSHPEDRQYLESLIHPRVRQILQAFSSQFESSYGLLVVPLLIEAGMTDLVDRVIVIDVPEELQIKRVMARDQIPEEQARNAISSQISRQERLKHADDVIDNTVTIDGLRDTVASLHNKYLQLALGR